ncbi:MAG TPA: hypothetical protein PKE10_04180 [Candidatus Saccharibacteria bacterium]|nr:hypothetical protein [Candidatus Saccharibacteria bacterium]HMR72488.1 hypothetical protein [Candidatus Saccharibacteria bacterium]
MIKMPGSKKPIWVVHGFDQQKLKLFILSYAFRASITERREFITFRLKKSDYVKIRNILLDKSGLDKYTIYCAKYSKYDESLILAPKKIPGSRGKRIRYIIPIPNNFVFIVLPKFMSPLKYKANGSISSSRSGFFIGETDEYYENKIVKQEMLPKLESILELYNNKTAK